MILDDLRYFHDNPFPSKLRNMQKWEIIKKNHIQICKIELETRNDFLAAETYSFNLKNTWFQNIDFFFKLISDAPPPLAQYISWYMFMKKIFSPVSFLQNDKIFDFVYVFILKCCKNKTKFQPRWRRWAT